ncbi:MAG: T9SS type A sorting domain-containing protein [Ignavibacteriales bacterium]|nr:T9SS type A sorting domain-containing protein [Ignavibacteriales bacterium]
MELILKTILFMAMNNSGFVTYDYSYKATGESSIVTLAYDLNEPTGVLPLTANDTICVIFDGVSGATLDSISVALRQAGSVNGAIYEYTGVTRPTPLGKKLLSNLTVTSTIAERPVYDTEAESYPIPFPNWVTVDLSSNNISASKPFVVAFVVEGTYPEFNRVMVTEQPDGNNHSFTNFLSSSAENKDWYYLTSNDAGDVYAYLVRAHAGFGITDVEEVTSELLPNEVSLEQNYPNPFNPSTMINFSIPKSEFVNLNVYNSLGEVVETLMNKEMSPGKYSVNFDGANLSSGVYYYRLSAEIQLRQAK